MTRRSNKPQVMVLEAQAKAALCIYRSVHEHGRRVITGSANRLCSGFFSRYVSRRVVYPSPSSQPEAFIDFLVDFLSRNEVEMLYPIGDSVTDLVAKHQERFREHTKLIMPDYETFSIGHDKILTNKAAERSGVPIPKSWYPDEQPLEEIARNEASYPCLVKPTVSVGAQGITYVNSAEELISTFPLVESCHGRSFVQELVPHEGGLQHKVDLLMGRDGQTLMGFVYDKLRFYPPTAGSSTLNQVVKRPEMLEQCRRMLVDLGWYGYCDFDFITDPRDGVAKMMEINPRFPDSLRAAFLAGLDPVEMMYRMAHGDEPEPQLDYREGAYLRFLPGDLMWFIRSPDRFKQFGSWCRFLARDMHYTILSLRDPTATLGYLLENLSVLFSREQRRRRFRLADISEEAETKD